MLQRSIIPSLALFIFSFCTPCLIPGALAGDIALRWDPNSEPDISGYNVYFGTQSGMYDAPGSPIFIPHPNTTITLTGLQNNQQYFFTLTAIDRSTNESFPAIEIDATISGDETSDGLQITNLTIQSGKAYVVKYDGLVSGTLPYIDRSYTFTSIPSTVQGSTYIQTANDDKNFLGSTFLTFDVNQPVTVYVAYDGRISPTPGWLSSFTPTNAVLNTSDTTLELYSQTFAAGTVTLGGNKTSGTGASMYVVAV